jgi:hypothetical protein
MRNVLTFLPLAVALVCHPSGLAAQRLEEGPNPSYGLRPPLLPIDQALADPPSLKNRILTGLAGAALGAGMGYFASQVATGDWEKGSGEGGVHRPTWAAVGGAGGLVLGFSVPLRGESGRNSIPSSPHEERFTIEGDEIRKAMVTTALNDDIKAYQDNVPLGNVDALAAIDISLIEEIRFYDSRRATAKWGMSHPHGAIQVVTLGKGSRR